jgi:microcystin-dependent protein
MSEPFLGEVRLLPYSFPPKGWALCNGQLLPIASNTALFSILGTLYGGNGTTNFALPNLPGCVVPGAGQGPGLQNWTPGMSAGSNTVTLTFGEMPMHNHGISALNINGTGDAPSNTVYLAQDTRGGQGNISYLVPGTTTADKHMNPSILGLMGGGQAHENRQPFLALNFCIAMQGIFPQRN